MAPLVLFMNINYLNPKDNTDRLTNYVIMKAAILYTIKAEVRNDRRHIGCNPEVLVAPTTVPVVRWPTTVTAKAPLQKQIRDGKSKSAAAKAKAPRQKQIRHGKSKSATAKASWPQ